MPVDQPRRQLGVKFFSVWYYTQPGVGILARKNRLAMNWYSFLGHEYNFFNAICKPFNHVKDIENPKLFGTLPTESPPGLCPRPQAAKTAALQSLFLLQNSIFFQKTDIN